MFDISQIATNLERAADGIWVSRNRSQISYPDDGNVRNLAIERDSFWYQHRNDCIVIAMRLFPPGLPLFDIGGGNGFVCAALRQAGIEAVLVEPGPAGAANARARGLPHVIGSTLEDAGFKPHSVPSLGLFDVLEHMETDEAFLRTLHSLLVTGGRLYLTVPAYNWLWSAEDDYAVHWRRYTLGALAKTLGAAGFVIDFQTYFFAWLPLPIFALRTVPGRLGLRTKSTVKRYAQENKLPDNWLGRLLRSLLVRELQRLKGGRSIAFGGSCLVVARAV